MVKALSVAERLEKAVSDYLLWMISNGYADSTCMQYQRILKYFFVFISSKAICWEDVLTFNTLKDFQKEIGLSHASNPVRGFPDICLSKTKSSGL